MRRLSVRGPRLRRVLLGLILAFDLATLSAWLLMDTRPPRWDESHYLSLAVQFARALMDGGPAALMHALLTLDQTRPPLVSFLAAPIALFAGDHYRALLAINVVWYGLLVLATYGLGARLRGPWCGVLAAALVSLMPGIYCVPRVFLQDFLNGLLVAASLYFLLRSDGFSNRRLSALFGCAAGLGALCRAIFPFFLAAPVLVTIGAAAWVHFREGSSLRLRTRITNASIAVLAVVVLAAPWYLANLSAFWQRSMSAAYGTESRFYGPQNTLSLTSLLTYSLVFLGQVCGFEAFLAFLAGMCALVIVLLRKRAARPPPASEVLTLLAAIVVPFAALETLRAHDYKNIIPILPSMAAVSAYGLSFVRPRMLQRVLVGSLLVAGLAQFWAASFPISIPGGDIAVSIRRDVPPIQFWHPGADDPVDTAPFFIWPKIQRWPIVEVLSRVAQTHEASPEYHVAPRPAVLAVLPNKPFFNSSNFGFFTMLKRLPILPVNPADDPSYDRGNFHGLFRNVDYVVICTGEPGPSYLSPRHAEMFEYVRSRPQDFERVGPDIDLPDGSSATIYRPAYRLTQAGLPEIQHPIRVVFDGGVEMLGYDLEDLEMTPNDRIYRATFYWSTSRLQQFDWKVFVHITPEKLAGNIVAGWDHFPADERCPVSQWQLGQTVVDRGQYYVPADLPSGSYAIRLGLFRPESGERLAVTSASQGVHIDDDGTRAAVGVLRVQ